MQTSESSSNASDLIIKEMKERLTYLRELLPRVEKTKNVSGNLRVDRCKRSFQYYIITTPGDTKGTYLPRKDIRKANVEYAISLARVLGCSVEDIIDYTPTQDLRYAAISKGDNHD